MTVNRKPTGTAVSIPAGMTWGLLWAAGITLAGACLTAKLIDGYILKWEDSGYAVLVILILSAWAGAMVASGRVKRQRAMVCLLSGAAYFAALLLVTALFFGGQYSGVGETALLILCGSILGIFTGYPGKTGRKTHKTAYRNR